MAVMAPHELDGFFESPEDAPPRRLAMLRGYFDESGHESKDWVVVAGFIGTRDQWNAFVPQWKGALGQRRSLHMRELRWNKDRTKRMLARLGPIPHACGLTGARGVVRVSDYVDLVVGKDDERLYPGYIACLLLMVGQIIEGIPSDERIEFVFEQQKQYEPYIDMVMRIYARPASMGGTHLNSAGLPQVARWAYVAKQSTVMTDPADYLAFALRSLHDNPNSTKTRWCLPIFAGNQGYGNTLERDMVRRIVVGAQKRNKEQGLD